MLSSHKERVGRVTYTVTATSLIRHSSLPSSTACVGLSVEAGRGNTRRVERTMAALLAIAWSGKRVKTELASEKEDVLNFSIRIEEYHDKPLVILSSSHSITYAPLFCSPLSCLCLQSHSKSPQHRSALSPHVYAIFGHD